MPVMTLATYNGARALLERDFADQPEALARAYLMLDLKRSASYAASGLCPNCGRSLVAGQSIYCSPQCINEDTLRDEAARAVGAQEQKARWLTEDAAAAAAKS